MAKKEKYIREITTAAGTKMLKIEIRAYGQSFRKSIKLSNYPSKKVALEEAKQIRDEALMKLRAGYTVEKSRIPTVKALFEKSYDLLPVRTETKKHHKYIFKTVLEQFGDKPIDRITAADIQGTITTAAKTNSFDITTRVLALWKRVYKVAALMEINVIDRTIAINIPECAEGKHLKKDISPEDLETFCDALLSSDPDNVYGNYRNYAIYYGIQIMKYCGLRPAEVFALTKNDIDLVHGHISVNKAVRSGFDSKLEIGKTKTEKSKRLVPIPEQLQPVLIECLRWSRNETLLADWNGNLISRNESNRVITKVKKSCGIDFHMYMLRHQFSTDLFRSGTDPVIIRDLMGHESATMSLDYATTKEEDRKQAIDKRRFS